MPELETQSERDFYDFCRRQGWIAEKLQESTEPDIRTPDFLVRTQTAYEFIAEVTEFEPEEHLKPGEIRVRGHTLGNPLRAKLNGKKSQVNSYSDRFPTLIVVCGGFEHFAKLEPISFDSALYGEMAITVSVPHDPRQAPTFDNKMHNAGRRFFGPTHNTSVSAIAALDRRPQRLRIYHNKFAKLPLDASRTKVGTSHVEHYMKDEGNNSGWMCA